MRGLVAPALTICLGGLIGWFYLDADALLGRIIGHGDVRLHRLDGLVIAALHVPAALALLLRRHGAAWVLVRGFGLGWVITGAVVWAALTVAGSTHAHVIESSLVLGAYVAAAIPSLRALREATPERGATAGGALVAVALAVALGRGTSPSAAQIAIYVGAATLVMLVGWAFLARPNARGRIART